MKVKELFKKIKPLVKNKYLLTSFIFLVWLSIFDQNNFVERKKILNNLNQLEKEKQFYIERIEKDSRRLKELRTSSENLEKFAREEYLMKKENEDIFLIVEK